jgi:hypothetical protein
MWNIAASILVASVALAGVNYYWDKVKSQNTSPGYREPKFLPRVESSTVLKTLKKARKVSPK